MDQLLIFHSVAKNLSFSRAADELNVSRSQVSKSIQILENYYSATLFSRTTRQIALTEAGEELLKTSTKILELTQSVRTSIRQMTERDSGRIRLTAPNVFGLFLFKSLIHTLERNLPNLMIQLDLSNDHRDLLKDDVDFAIRLSSEIPPDLIARPLGRIRDAICASPEFLKKHSLQSSYTLKHVSPDILKNIPCILGIDPTWNTWILKSKNGNASSTEAHGKLKSNNYGMLKQLCLDGHGITRLPLYLVEDELKEKKLISLFSEYEISTHPVFLVYKRSPYSSKKHKLLRDLIIQWFKMNRHFLL